MSRLSDENRVGLTQITTNVHYESLHNDEKQLLLDKSEEETY